ncbi:hypothetical protein SPI_06353 [Niveomyces insectorum RCEF 264]|uniref:Uncharacterized protein n=1 Tax=Niveomyces insectorum RCEF 264 TaxID=1081102 RepID=A0A167S1V5_9HYPO|nr:hypothetical protein SPI_06353 [Niveomyces insectorum RCEF 264]
MLFLLLVTMLVNPFRPCEGAATYQEEYRGNYLPQFVRSELGHLQVVAPDTPYVAAAGRSQLYFIDTRFDPESASHIKAQIEHATVPQPDQYTFIDEVTATAERRNATTHETLFVFDPAYARVLFARSFNKRNPALNLPEHGPAGDWLVEYSAEEQTLARRGEAAPSACSDHGCTSDADCTPHHCQTCHIARVDNECETPMVNAVGKCKKKKKKKCTSAVDEPKLDGETDAAYYQRMNALHWEEEEEEKE